MAVVKTDETNLHPALEAICEQLRLNREAVRASLEDADRREFGPGGTSPALTPGDDLEPLIGAWDMSRDEWEEIHRDLVLMRRVEE